MIAWTTAHPTRDEQGSWFEDITQQAGVDHKHTNRSFENVYAHIMEGYTALGAAVAVADYDGDGFEDLFVTVSKLSGKNRGVSGWKILTGWK